MGLRVVRFILGASWIASSGCGALEAIVSGFDPPKPLPTIDGPEDEHLLDGIRATLLQTADDGELLVTALPNHSRRRIQLAGSAASLSGPDEEGRIAYQHGSQVRWYDLSTQRETVLVDLKDPSRHATSSVSSIALAPHGGRVLVGLSTPEAMGAVEIPERRQLLLCTIGRVDVRSLGPLSVDRVSWFADGIRAAVELWVRSADENEGRYPHELVEDAGTRDRATRSHEWPSVQIVDTETGGLRWVAWGRMPCVSPDGRRLLYMLSPEEPLRLRDLDTGEESALDLPGFLRPSHWRQDESDLKSEGLVHGWLSDRIVLYDAVGTTGENPGFVPSSGMQGYYPKWTVKAADIRTRAFRTLIPSVDNDLTCSIGAACAGGFP